ncbi:Uncharacterized protein SCG7086_AI_00190 [Chlamydiales bacterium SCGC AG-110-P3]|nr:Uncharacterized protein SCG7086_AI_00190 [Chlamydiales bacterium SCGC AG-110-P3]
MVRQPTIKDPKKRGTVEGSELAQPSWAPGALFYLFHVLLLQLLLYPYLGDTGESRNPWLLTATNVMVITAIAYTISAKKRQWLIAAVIGLPTVVLCWFHTGGLQWTVLILTMLLYAYAIFLLIPHIFKTKIVGLEEVYAVTSAYVLIGLAWSHLYQAIDWLYPGSFHLAEAGIPDATLTWAQYLFFSFTTLTTLGYGDIAPSSVPAQSLAIVESVTGVIFIAVVVARAIALFVYQTLFDEQARK